MAIRPQYTASELRVLQEAVASAVHELSQPLNVVNLLADNALEDIAILQEEGTADPDALRGLRRRLESIVERAEKASDIIRWIRAFAVDIGEEGSDFDPEAVFARIIGIFGNDLRVAGVELQTAPPAGQRIAVGNEALLGFALTEIVLWLAKELPRPAPDDHEQETSVGRIYFRCLEDPAAGTIVVAVDGMVASEASVDPAAAVDAASARAGTRIPTALPLLSVAGRVQGCTVTMARTAAGSVRIRLSLPQGLPVDGMFLGVS